jgi:hypothetical protein
MGSPGAVLIWSFALTIGLVVVVVVPLRALDVRHLRRLRESGKTVNAYVTSLGERSDDGMTSASYWTEVSWDADGRTFSARVYLSHRKYRELRTGSRLTVAYRPGRERRARALG